MTKSELIDRLCQAGGISPIRAESIVDAIFDSIENALKRGERTEIRGFGSFEIRNYGRYVGRNPRSGSTVEVKAKRLPFFKVGKELRDRINEAAQLKHAQRKGPMAATATVSTAPVMTAPNSLVSAPESISPAYPQLAARGR